MDGAVMTVPPDAAAAAQGYDFAHRFDDDQPRVISWGRVPDYQVARLLAGAAPLIAAAERQRIRHLAEEHGATYRTTGDADPSPFAEDFADLIGGDT